MKLYQKCIPNYYFQSIFEIPYQTLKKQGINSLFFDLDNTIISYDQEVLNQEQINYFNELSKDFLIFILSNTNHKRVSTALANTNFKFIWHAKKPLSFGFKKALKITNKSKSEVIMIGDQLMTDVLGANSMGIQTILVKSVKRKSDHKITRFNRKLENMMIKKIMKNEPILYEERLKQYVLDH
jgi:HAD superfamily phosphatase (TIGR01668 family)